MTLTDKVCVITGSSRGIGKKTAEAFLEAGAEIVINGRDENNLNRTFEEFSKKGFVLSKFRGDVAKTEEAKALIGFVREKFGRLDILVNNAGISDDHLLVRMAESEWDTVIENNLKSVYNCSRFASRLMMKQKSGRIINVSSVVALGGNPFQTNYAASKSGINGFTMALAKELAPYNITVNAVAPGYIKTDMTRHFTDEAVAQILNFVPLGRPGEPDEVGFCIRFLASDEAAYITGQVINVDGGRVIR